MKQYCRYCNWCTAEEYCTELDKSVNARSLNRCSDFCFNEIDSLMIEDSNGQIHTYKPRIMKEKQCKGQLSLF